MQVSARTSVGVRAPASPTLPPVVGPQSGPAGTAVSAPSGGPGSLDRLSYAQLRDRFNALQSQRQTLADRRSNVAGTYERATGISKEGIGARLAVMDQSMVNIESQLADVGQAMVNRPQSSFPMIPPNGGNPAKVAAQTLFASAAVFAAMLFVIVPAAVRRAKRRWLREDGLGGTRNVAGADRLNRIEQAVDAIAIEIERVSENQRFMTRLMTETQLAGTIAAVKSSAEAAKSEAR